ncbi:MULTISPECIES: hypothetical protein [unclassified Streptomyces]|uniref:hypothetical protein n=1 Tax=unclassified Streptomyces TaxID=2593676 RepID=UPI0029A781CE|nr:MULTISPECIES: hypothetical protein [unclassified Streptomyces]MDX3772119.1 hypothetical protein [Streptomyces sp. AK08-01B]MDX3821646.1 hypothetical protein [Streptomyces sp. AK08-01A]
MTSGNSVQDRLDEFDDQETSARLLLERTLRLTGRRLDHHRAPDILHTPSNLWGTKVCGPRPLVEALLGDLEIEAIRLPWTS